MNNSASDWEQEFLRIHGASPEIRAAKNRKYAARLVRRFSEPIVRGLLSALSTLESPYCAHWLSGLDLKATPLAEIIQPHEPFGFDLRVVSVKDGDYTVNISMGGELAGDAGTFVITHLDGKFFIKEEVMHCIY